MTRAEEARIPLYSKPLRAVIDRMDCLAC